VIEIRVEGPDDPRLTDYVGLRDPARRSRLEPQGGFFIAEGVMVIERLLASDTEIRSVFATPKVLERLRPAIEGRDVTAFVGEPSVMRTVVGFDIHRGALASANRPPARSVGDVVEGAVLVAALEGLNDHENIGSLFRSAAGLGVDAVLLDQACADPWYRRSVRVSMGSVLDVPMARTASLPRALLDLRGSGFRVLAMTLSDDAVPLSSLAAGPPTVVAFGAEGSGLSAETRSAADVEVTIRMSRQIDSLNVGHAAAIAFHHFAPRP
jgi:tRNA G18 (ribose-2'-O)-methylase SpoU